MAIDDYAYIFGYNIMMPYPSKKSGSTCPLLLELYVQTTEIHFT